jgi:hypothetical protein
MISLLLNSREQNRQNKGNIAEWVDCLRKSVSSTSNVEVIIKYDTDDDAALPVITNLIEQNKDLDIKYRFTKREGYGGQHIGYSQGFSLISDESVAVYPMPDDTFFTPGTHWDQWVLDHAKAYSDGIFLVKMAPLDQFTDIILFSRNLIERIGFGPTFAVDQWGFSLCRLLTELGVKDRILCAPEAASRRGCELDFKGMSVEGDARWDGPRQEAMDLIASDSYRVILDMVKENLKTYLKL